ncbi:MAG: hypothetical protein ACQEUT_11975 [Bacillota bacterium]
MIKNKLALFSSAVILIFCRFLYFPFPNNNMIDARTTFMSFPITDIDGYNPLAIMRSILFIIAMVLLVKGLNKYRVRTLIITAIVYALMPLPLISVYQETLAEGVAAISYDGQGTCDFEEVSEGKLYGECNLNLHNRSGKPVALEIEFLDSSYMPEGIRMDSLMNEAGPYTVRLQANSKETVEIKELLDLSQVKNRIDGGSSMNVHIKISDGNNVRLL